MGKKKETIDSALRATWQIVSRMYNTEAVNHGFTIAIGHFLLNIDPNKGTYASDIAPKLGTEGTSLSKLIASIEEMGYIIRIPDEDDKRRTKILLTSKGLEKRNISIEVVKSFNQSVVDKIGIDQFNTLLESLGVISELAREKYIDSKQENRK